MLWRVFVALLPLILFLVAREVGYIVGADYGAGVDFSSWPGSLFDAQDKAIDWFAWFGATVAPVVGIPLAGIAVISFEYPVSTVTAALQLCFLSMMWTPAQFIWIGRYHIEQKGWLDFFQHLKPVAAMDMITFVIALVVYTFIRSGKGRFALDPSKEIKKEIMKGGLWRQSFMSIFDVSSSKTLNPPTVAGSPHSVILAEAYLPCDKPELGGEAPLIRWVPDGMLLTVAGAGTNKTVAVCIPNALITGWAGPMLCNDPATEILPVVRASREAAGRKIKVFDMHTDTTFGMNALSIYDPLHPKIFEDVKAFVTTLDPSSGKPAGENQVWVTNAQNSLICVILFVLCDPSCEGRRNLITVNDIIANDFRGWLRTVIDHPGCFGMIANLAKKLDQFFGDTAPGVENKALANTMGSINTLTDIFMTPLKAAWLSGIGIPPERVFDPKDFYSAGDIDIWFCFDTDTLKNEPSLAKTVLLVFWKMFERSKRRKYETLFLLDEAAITFGNLPLLEDIRDGGRKYGIILWYICQSMGQLRSIFKDGAHEAWLDVFTRQYFGVKRYEHAEELEKTIGYETTKVKSVSENKGDSKQSGQLSVNRSTGKQISESLQKTEVLSASEIMTMSIDDRGRPDEQILFVGQFRPIRCGLAKSWRRPEMKAIMGDNPYLRKRLDEIEADAASEEAAAQPEPYYGIDPKTGSRVIYNVQPENLVERVGYTVNGWLRAIGIPIHEWDPE